MRLGKHETRKHETKKLETIKHETRKIMRLGEGKKGGKGTKTKLELCSFNYIYLSMISD